MAWERPSASSKAHRCHEIPSLWATLSRALPGLQGCGPLAGQFGILNGLIYMGGCQNYGPFLDPHKNTARNIYGTPKGIIFLTTTHTHECTGCKSALHWGLEQSCSKALQRVVATTLNPSKPRLLHDILNPEGLSPNSDPQGHLKPYGSNCQ